MGPLETSKVSPILIFLCFLDENQNCKAAAEDFLILLKKTYGDNIFKAIIESHDSRYLSELEGLAMIENSYAKTPAQMA
jgi:hypothetical protein